MAQRRMFNLKIIDTDLFLDMPITARLLYYDLSMRGDDDGFVASPKKIQRMIGCSDDDLRLLIAKQFIIPFESGICVIKHWKIHNYIRSDRYSETIYREEKQQLIEENGSYELNDIPTVDKMSYQMDTQVRLGKVRLELGKDRLDNNTSTPVDYQSIIDLYNKICISYPKVKSLSNARKKSIKARLTSGYSLNDFENLFNKAESSTFLKGGNNRNWLANFDWLIKDSNMAKVLDGNYDNKENGYGYTTGSKDTERENVAGSYNISGITRV